MKYFSRSEQIPDAGAARVGEEWRGGRSGSKTSLARRRHAAAFLPKAPERRGSLICIPAMRRRGVVTHSIEEDDAWIEGQSLISTVEDVELIDPDLSGERLLYRLFHERGVRVFPPLPLRAQCSCSREAVSSMPGKLCAEGPRRNGQGWQGGRDLRVLLIGLSIHARRGGRGVGGKTSLRNPSLPGLTGNPSIFATSFLPKKDGSPGQIR